MIVGTVTVTEADGVVERSAPVRWRAGELTLTVSGAADVVDRSDDATGFAAIALPVSMRLGEDLWVEGPVSPMLVRQAEMIQEIYTAWDPWSRRVALHVAETSAGVPSGVAACVFSRGVDSMYSAVSDQAGPKRFRALTFVDSLEPRHSSAVRAEELRHARALADQLGLPLLTASTNVRTFIDMMGWDWEDILGAGLSCVAQGMAGAINRLCIASTESYVTLGPSGTHPLLDPLYSSERVAIEHDSVDTNRLGKVQRLAACRPDLLWGLKVCFSEDRADNCGRCNKCLLTMVCLHICGALDQASQFPDTIDTDAVRQLRLPHLPARHHWTTAADALGHTGGDGRLRQAILAMITASAIPRPVAHGTATPPWLPIRQLRDHQLNTTLALIVDGVPYQPAPDPTSR